MEIQDKAGSLKYIFKFKENLRQVQVSSAGS